MKEKLFAIFLFLFLGFCYFYAQGDSNEMIELANKLELCEAYNQNFTHPFTGESLNRQIVGVIDDKCLYIEEMPNNGKMECRYSEDERKAVAQYYRDLDKAKSASTKSSIKDGKLETKYAINGKEVINPLQECTNSGVCIISGY